MLHSIHQYIVLALLLVLASSGSAQGIDPIRKSEIETEMADVLTQSRAFNPLDEMDVRIEGCRLSWRREFVSRQCKFDWTVYANTISIDLSQFPMKIHDTLSSVTFADRSIPIGSSRRIDTEVPEKLQSIDALLAMDWGDSALKSISEFCDNSVVASVEQGFLDFRLYDDARERFQQLISEIRAKNQCDVASNTGLWGWLKSLL